jgi:hypothetical protein
MLQIRIVYVFGYHNKDHGGVYYLDDICFVHHPQCYQYCGLVVGFYKKQAVLDVFLLLYSFVFYPLQLNAIWIT